MPNSPSLLLVSAPFSLVLQSSNQFAAGAMVRGSSRQWISPHAKMINADLEAIVAYLRTVPPL
jgi:hypothetical protein